MNKRNQKRHEIERVTLYGICLVLLGLVIGLAVRNYRLELKLADCDKDVVIATETSPESEASSVTEETTELLPEVRNTVEYRDIEETAAGESDEYNGEELRDNGCRYAIKINRQENIVTVYELGEDDLYSKPVKAMRCSVSPSGETPLGIFNISNKWEWLALFDNCYGQYVSQIEGDTLFHSVPYLETSKDTLETWEFNKLGTAASMGCIRLCVADTKWIYDNCEPGTYVDIFDSDYYGPLGRPSVVTALADTSKEGWDPTDMDENNPYTGTGAIYGVESHSINLDENYDSMAGVMAFNSDMEDVTDKLTVMGDVDNSLPGEYKVSYSFEDTDGTAVAKTIVITVVDDRAPTVTRLPVCLEVANYAMQQEMLAELVAGYVTADDDGQVITDAVAVTAAGKTISGESVDELDRSVIAVNVSKVRQESGTYEAECYAVDAYGNMTEKYTVEIRVIND